MYFSRIYFAFFMLFFSGFIFGMGKVPALKSAVDVSSKKLLFNKCDQKIVAAIKNVKKGGSIAFESPFFSSKSVQKALINAAERGVDVSIHTISRSKANFQELEDAGCTIKLVHGLHAKRIIIKDGKKKQVYIGSDNFSTISWAHKEDILEVKNDENFYHENMKTFTENDAGYDSPTPTIKKVIKKTPIKLTLVGSRNYKINESKSERIKTLADNPSNQNRIDINSMTFDSEDIVESIAEVYNSCEYDDRPQIRLFVDASAAKHRDLLNEIKEVGGQDCQIYIYNEDRSVKVNDKFPALQHRKLIARKCMKRKNSDYLVIASTGNLTEQSDAIDINYDTYLSDKKLAQQIFTENDKLAAESVEYMG